MIDKRKDNGSAQLDIGALGLAPVAVSRWSAQLVDRACERDYRLDRFTADRRRVQVLVGLAGLAATLNFLLELYRYSHGDSEPSTLYAAFGFIWLPLLGLSLAFRMRTPAALEAFVALALTVGVVTRLTLLSLHPDYASMWTTLMVGIVFVIYLYLPVRLVLAAALALAFSIAAPLWWQAAQPGLPFDQFARGLIAVLICNALGFAAANSIHRSQRTQFAQRLVLQQLLSTDATTGIANRRRFDIALDREWRRCGRTGAPLSLLMIDVDHFKAYNDYSGHPQGDSCLRQVAQVLVDTLKRPGDLAARYGGEEFVCLLPEISAAGALKVAERLMTSLRQTNIPHARSPLGPRLTISIGVATASTLNGDAQRLVEFADRLLYAAKGAGRNQVKVGRLAPERESRAA